tara:strand:+ start:607 stop:1131 length:525 start_codon:yes stop_codon:yes gene_type:complete
MSGKSLTEHITDLVTKSLYEHEKKNTDFYSDNKINDLQERILTIESIVSNREYVSKELKPFNDSEAINCTKYMKGLFDKELQKRNFVDKKTAFDDFLFHLEAYIHSNNFPSDRLREIMINDKPIPWTGKELNDLTLDSKCNCPIRKALIKWTGKTDFPSQQEICDKGEKLLSLI